MPCCQRLLPHVILLSPLCTPTANRLLRFAVVGHRAPKIYTNDGSVNIWPKDGERVFLGGGSVTIGAVDNVEFRLTTALAKIDRLERLLATLLDDE